MAGGSIDENCDNFLSVSVPPPSLLCKPKTNDKDDEKRQEAGAAWCWKDIALQRRRFAQIYISEIWTQMSILVSLHSYERVFGGEDKQTTRITNHRQGVKWMDRRKERP